MDNDLVSIYESAYLNAGSVVQEKQEPVEDNEDEGSDETPKSSEKKSFGGAKKKKKSMSKSEIGGITYDSYKRSETVFDKILREMNEMGGGADAGSVGDDNNVFDTDEFAGDDDMGEESYTVSELRSMTLGELANLLAGGEDEAMDFDDSDLSEGDEVPRESYGFTGGEGNHFGSQGNYSGKAGRQSPSNHVKANGDADFGTTETDYDPEEIDGNEESNHKGSQGNYDGKAKRQGATTHVKANGDADFGKVKTGFNTSSGKKPKNYF
jgi:hypothetical protein